LSTPEPDTRTIAPRRVWREDVVRARLSALRFEPYEVAGGGDITRALELYAWNAEISASFFELIQYLEVVLRNALHEQILRIHAMDDFKGAWYDRGETWFHENDSRKIESARDKIRFERRAVTDDRMVTQLGFGFWRFLLKPHYHRTLWEPGLRLAFPNLTNAMDNRGLVDRKVADVHNLRNRIAHHESLLKTDLDSLHQTMFDVLTWICADTEEWVRQQSRVPGLLSRRP
jgi:hypothetical protein